MPTDHNFSSHATSRSSESSLTPAPKKRLRTGIKHPVSQAAYAYRALDRGQFGVVGIPVRDTETVLYVRTRVLGPWPSEENLAMLRSALNDVLAFGGTTSTTKEQAAQERLLEPALRQWQSIMNSAAVQADATRGHQIKFAHGMSAASRTWFEPAESVPLSVVHAFRMATDVLHDLLIRVGSLTANDREHAQALLRTLAPDGAPRRDGVA